MSGSWTLPHVIFDRKVSFFQKLCYFKVFLGKTKPKVPFFKDSRCCPKIQDYTLSEAKLYLKPWITPGIRKPMKVKNHKITKFFTRSQIFFHKTWEGLEIMININKTTKKEANCLNINRNEETYLAILNQIFNKLFWTILKKINSTIHYTDYLTEPTIKTYTFILKLKTQKNWRHH